MKIHRQVHCHSIVYKNVIKYTNSRYIPKYFSRIQTKAIPFPCRSKPDGLDWQNGTDFCSSIRKWLKALRLIFMNISLKFLEVYPAILTLTLNTFTAKNKVQVCSFCIEMGRLALKVLNTMQGVGNQIVLHFAIVVSWVPMTMTDGSLVASRVCQAYLTAVCTSSKFQLQFYYY